MPKSQVQTSLIRRLGVLALVATTMPPATWQKRYYRESSKYGKELLLLQRSGTRGVRTAMDPDFQVTTVGLDATTEVPATGIKYREIPTPTASQKEAAMTSSEALVEAGIRGAESKTYRDSAS